jgi:nucleoside-diphosphate-sugar epimerase
MVKKKILLTGASGTVGKEVFKELLKRTNKYEISLFIRGSKKNRKLFKRYIDNVRIIWGTLQNYQEVKEAINEQDVVIHIAGALPDVAFKNPEIVVSTNVEGTQNVIKAMENQKNLPKLIFTSSVAVYGDRRKNPIIKLSDPVDKNTKDLYASTKIQVEKLIRESKLEYCIFRLPFVLSIDVLKFRRVMFYIALDTSVESIHAKDVGLALVNAIESKEVWNNTFNLGGGNQCQKSYRDNLDDMYEIMGFGRGFLPEEAFSKEHSHCGYYDEQETSYIQSILKFQNFNLEDFYKEVNKWIGIKKYIVPIVKPLLRWYFLRRSEFYQEYRRKRKKKALIS